MRNSPAQQRDGRHVARIVLSLLFASCVAWLAPSLYAQVPARAAAAARIDSIVNAALAADRTPGITVGVVRGNDTIVLKGYGLADVENNVPVSPQSVFRIGSITKQFTSSAVMKLVEQGKIRLDATLGEILPDYPGPGRRVTIHQLLNHTSGIPSYTSMGPKFWDRSRLDLTHAEMLELFARDTLDFEPGSRWLYDNSGYYLLGMVLEKVSGESYPDHLQHVLFGPLGLTQTMYCGQHEIIMHRVQGYMVENGRVFNAAPLSMGPPFAAGALCSTPRDLIHWTRLLHAGKVVSPQSFTTMTTPTRLSTGTTNPYGYGLSRAQLGSLEAIQHGGGINGFSAFLAHYPAENLTVAVIANGPTNTGALHTKIVRAALGLPEPALVDLPTTPAERARYVGTYDLAPDMELKVRMVERDGRLVAEPAGQGAFPLRKLSEHTFDGPEGTGIRITFTLTGDRVTGFTLRQGGGTMTARRIE